MTPRWGGSGRARPGPGPGRAGVSTSYLPWGVGAGVGWGDGRDGGGGQVLSGTKYIRQRAVLYEPGPPEALTAATPLRWGV